MQLVSSLWIWFAHAGDGGVALLGLLPLKHSTFFRAEYTKSEDCQNVCICTTV